MTVTVEEHNIDQLKYKCFFNHITHFLKNIWVPVNEARFRIEIFLPDFGITMNNSFQVFTTYILNSKILSIANKNYQNKYRGLYSNIGI